jgi:hypothetical protein
VLLYLQAHRAFRALFGSVAVTLAAWWFSGTFLPLPQLLQGRASPVAAELLFTTLFAPLTAYAFGGVVLRLEQLSRRRLWRQDLALAGIILLPVAVAAVTAVGIGAPGLAATMVRNAAVFVGIALLMLTFVGESAAVGVPIAYFLLMSTVGARADGSAHWWAGFRAEAEPLSISIGITLFILGITLFPGHARNRVAKRGVTG